MSAPSLHQEASRTLYSHRGIAQQQYVLDHTITEDIREEAWAEVEGWGRPRGWRGG